MLITESTSQYLSVAKVRFLEEWNVSTGLFFGAPQELLLTDCGFILARSAWSRADKPVIEIGDLSEKESMKYLIDKRKINSVEAKKLYDLVGGRIVELMGISHKLVAGQYFEGKN